MQNQPDQDGFIFTKSGKEVTVKRSGQPLYRFTAPEKHEDYKNACAYVASLLSRTLLIGRI